MPKVLQAVDQLSSELLLTGLLSYLMHTAELDRSGSHPMGINNSVVTHLSADVGPTQAAVSSTAGHRQRVHSP